MTVTDADGHAIGRGCADQHPGTTAHTADAGNATAAARHRAGPGTATDRVLVHPAGRDGPPGGYGTWTLRVPGGGPDLIVTLDPLTTEHCDHRFESRGHDPGVKLRHLARIRHATCVSPICRRPAATSDYEHNIPYEAGGRTCLCNAGPQCQR